jgi:hypothetical protein
MNIELNKHELKLISDAISKKIGELNTYVCPEFHMFAPDSYREAERLREDYFVLSAKLRAAK